MNKAEIETVVDILEPERYYTEVIFKPRHIINLQPMRLDKTWGKIRSKKKGGKSHYVHNYTLILLHGENDDPTSIK